MLILRRLGITAALVILIGATSANSAGAQNADTFSASASGRALSLKVGSDSLTAGFSHVKTTSSPSALAEGAGQLSLLGDIASQKSEVNANDSKASNPKKCGTPELPAALKAILNAGIACSETLAEVKGSSPHAFASGSVAELDLTAQTLVNTPISTVQPTVTSLLGTLSGVTQVTGVNLAVTDSVTQLLDALGTTKTLEVRLGTSTSEITTDGSKVTAVAVAEGGTVSVLPLGAAGLKPVVEIVVSSSKATSTYDRAKGKSTASFDPAIVTVNVNTPVVDQLGKITGQNLNVIKLDVNTLQSQLPLAGVAGIAGRCADAANEYCVLAGTPFETRIAAGSGRTFSNPDGTEGAVADGVKITALKNIGTLVGSLQGGIVLELAHAETAVSGKVGPTAAVLPIVQAQPAVPAIQAAEVQGVTQTRQVLAKTGTSPLGMQLGLAALAGALMIGSLLLRSRRLSLAGARDIGN